VKRLKRLSRLLPVVVALALVVSPFFGMPPAQAATLTGGFTALDDGRPDQTSVSYTIEFDNVTTSAIKCIKMVFSDAATGGSVPSSMDTTSASITDGSTDYIPTSASWTEDVTTNGTIEFTYATGETPASASDATIVVGGIENGDTADTTYYLQFSTYNNTEWSSDAVDSAGVSVIYTSGQAVSLTVDPSISFAIAGVNSSESVNGATTTETSTSTTIPLGTVTSSTNGVAAHDTTVTTNAGGGYTTYIKYTAVPTSGSDTIDDCTGTNSSPSTTFPTGTEAFGYTTEDSTLSVTGDGADRFTNPGNEWAKFTTSNLEAAYSSSEVSSETIRIGYQVAIAATTAAGTYTTTVVLTCTPTY